MEKIIYLIVAFLLVSTSNIFAQSGLESSGPKTCDNGVIAIAGDCPSVINESSLRSTPKQGHDGLYNPLRIYPTAFSGHLDLEYAADKASAVTITLYDAQGKLVDQIMRNKWQSVGYLATSYDGSHLAQGTYICTLETEHYLIRQKLIKVK